MRIYNNILIVYFKLIIDSTLNLYKRCFNLSSLIIIDNKKEYKIKRLIKKRRRRFKKVKKIII